MSEKDWQMSDDVSKMSDEELWAMLGIAAPKGGKSNPTKDGLPFRPFGIDTGMTMPQGLSNFMAGIGQGMNSIKQGVTFAPQSVVDETKAIDAPLLETGAGTAGSIFGNIATMAPAAFIPGANTVVGSTLIGGGLGGLTTPGSSEDRFKGGLLSGAGGFAGQMIPKSLGVLKAASEPFTQKGQNAIIGRVMNAAAGDNAPSVIGRLANARQLIPGSAPTAAEVAESGGIAALQRAMSAAAPEDYTHRAMQQSTARLNALRGVAGTDADLSMQKGVRGLMSEKLYEEALAAPVDKGLAQAMAPQIQNLMERPSMQQAIDRAKNIFGEKTITLAKEGSPEGLQMVKQALDDIIEKAGSPNSSIGKNELKALNQTRSDLMSTLEELTPKLREADRAYASWSRPVNEMQIGRTLLDKLTPALSDYGALGKETAAQYARALKDAPRTIKTATGRSTQSLEDILSPGNLQAVENVARDLARKANAQDLGRGAGSNTFQNFAMDNLAKEMGMPSAVKGIFGHIPGLSPMGTLVARGAGAMGGAAYKRADEAMRQTMAQALLNPNSAAALMANASRPGLLEKSLRALPPKARKDALEAIQSAPGIFGMAGIPAYLSSANAE
jgi:hypothetical protein